MAFPRESTVVPTAIADQVIQLFDPDPTGSEQQSASVTIQIRMSDGRTVVRTFNLVNHVSGNVITQLQALAANLRQLAVDEILPEAE